MIWPEYEDDEWYDRILNKKNMTEDQIKVYWEKLPNPPVGKWEKECVHCHNPYIIIRESSADHGSSYWPDIFPTWAIKTECPKCKHNTIHIGNQYLIEGKE